MEIGKTKVIINYAEDNNQKNQNLSRILFNVFIGIILQSIFLIQIIKPHKI